MLITSCDFAASLPTSMSLTRRSSEPSAALSRPGRAYFFGSTLGGCASEIAASALPSPLDSSEPFGSCFQSRSTHSPRVFASES